MLELLIAVAFQVIQVNQTTPCFLNDTAGVDIWRNCGLGDDYLSGALLGWEWITGGYFSLILACIFMGITYIKYQNVMYPLIIGSLLLPVSYFIYPNDYLSFAGILACFALGFRSIYILVKQTKEYYEQFLNNWHLIEIFRIGYAKYQRD